MDAQKKRQAFVLRFLKYQRQGFSPFYEAIAMLFLAVVTWRGAELAVGARPSDAPFIAALLVVIGMFFILRVHDDIRDIDVSMRLERPVAHTLLRLSELRLVSVIVMLFQAAALLTFSPNAWALLIATWGWLFLLRFNFGAGEWLQRQYTVHLALRMLAMPLIALLAISIATMGTDAAWQKTSLLLAGMTFCVGVTIEIARKLHDGPSGDVGHDGSIQDRSATVLVWGLASSILCVLTLYIVLSDQNSIVAISAMCAAMVVILTVRLLDTTLRQGLPVRAFEVASVFLILSSLFLTGCTPWLI